MINGNFKCAFFKTFSNGKFYPILDLFQEAYNMVNKEKAKVELSEKLQMESKMKVNI